MARTTSSFSDALDNAKKSFENKIYFIFKKINNEFFLYIGEPEEAESYFVRCCDNDYIIDDDLDMFTDILTLDELNSDWSLLSPKEAEIAQDVLFVDMYDFLKGLI